MKKTISKILAVLMFMLLFFSISAAAADETFIGEAGKNITWEYDSETMTLRFDGTGAMDDTYSSDYPTSKPTYANRIKGVIKNVVIGDGITSIGANAFSGCNYLETVTLGKDIETIGEKAFYNCIKLKTVTFSENIKEIRKQAFYNCSSATVLPCEIENSTIGELAFYGTGITSVTIKDSIKYDKYVFESSKLEKVQFENSIESTAHGMFFDCRKLSEVSLPDSLKKISDYTFTECIYLKNVDIPSSVTEVGHFAFMSSGVSDITIKSGVNYGIYAFSESKVKSVTFEEGVTVTSHSMFRRCKELAQVHLPESLETIAPYTFYGCEKLSEIALPSSLKEIDERAFSTTGLMQLTICKDVQYGIYAFEHTNLREIIIEDGFKKIPEGLFYECEKLAYLVVPDSVTSIGKNAFYNCTSLKSAFIGKNVSVIHDNAFYNCSSLENLVILTKDAVIYDAFSRCNRNIKNIVDFSRQLDFFNDFDAETLANRTHIYTYKDIIGFDYIKASGIKHTALNDYEYFDGDHLFCDFYYEITKKPTCSAKGECRYICLTCGKKGENGKLEMLPHIEEREIIPATTEADGQYLDKCKLCNNVNTTVIPKIEKVSFTRTAETSQNGTVEVFDSNGKKIKSYTITYENNANVGVAKVNIKFSGDYSGTVTREFVIKPGSLTLRAEFFSTDSIKLSWLSNVGINGCTVEIFISKDKENWTHLKRTEGTSTIIDSLDEISHYYIKAYVSSEYGNSPESPIINAHTDLSLGEPVVISKYCGNDTLEYYRCKTCNYTQIVKLPGLAKHVYDENNPETYVEAKCGVDGHKIFRCLECGYSVYVTETATPHNFGEWVTTVEPTCSKLGEKSRTCSVCNHTEKVSIMPIEHTVVTDNRIAPTCTKAGKTQGSHCSVCGEIISEQIKILALGHVGGEATCTQKKVCTRCNMEYGSLNLYNHTAVVTDKAVKATCSKTGLTEGTHCKDCGTVIEVQETVKKKAHTYAETLTKATTSKDGSKVTKCTVCGNVKTNSRIAKISSVTLSKTSYTYDGKAKKPTVTVTDSNGKVIANTNYTVAYSNNTAIGTATVKITFKGNYSGTKSLTFKIVPGQVTGLKASSVTTTSIKLSWTKVSGAKYYKVEQSTDGKTWKVLTTTDKTTYTVSKLTAGSKMQYRVTALDSTKKIAGKVSAVLKTGTKTSAPTVTLKSSKSKTATATWKKVTGASKYAVYKSTDNKKWTKVGETTKLTYDLTKLTGGKKIYVKVVAVNAYKVNSADSKVVSVTVKK